MSYYIIKNYSKLGKIGIADKVFEKIVAYVLINEQQGVTLKRRLFQPHSISIMRKGAELKVSAAVAINSKPAPETKKLLEDKIADTIYTLTELRPSSVNIRIEWQGK